jgi:hypothetical protein
MGSFRFRRSIRVAPGVRLNLNKRSVGLSAGIRGARVSVNSDGRSTRSVGLPGTGLYYRSQTGPRRRPPARAAKHGVGGIAVMLAILLILMGFAHAAGYVLAIGFLLWLVAHIFTR